jgi:hypothetical protein
MLDAIAHVDKNSRKGAEEKSSICYFRSVSPSQKRS